MVKLNCVILGVVRSAFIVDIDEDKLVGDLKKAVKVKNSNKLKDVDANKLHLFLAKKGDAWLLGNDVAAQALNDGMTNPDVRKMIRENNMMQMLTIQEVLGHFKMTGEHAPSSKQVHVLVQVPNEVSRMWKLLNENCPALIIDKSPLIRISTTYTLGSGLRVNPGKDLLLYRRPQVIEEWQFIEKCVCNTFAELWIVGPPEMGKSYAAFAFACFLDRTDWDVLWIHCPIRSFGPLKCIIFRGATEKWACEIPDTELASVLQKLARRTVVFVDGYTKKETSGYIIQQTSMTTLGKDNYQDQCDIIPTVVDDFPLKTTANLPKPASQADIRDEMLFKVKAWTLEDYKMAMVNDKFFEHVKTKYTDTKEPVLLEEWKQLLEEKFFVAGGISRYMFDYSVDDVVGLLDNAILAVDNIKGYVKGTRGMPSEGAVTQLFSKYRDEDSPKSRLVSKHVARKLAQKIGPEFVRKLSNLLSSNHGYLFELWFFAKLSHGGVECNKVGQIIPDETWIAVNGLPNFDSNGGIPLNKSKMWLAPRMWNQGGYDVVFVEIFDDAGAPTVRVRFVQVTRADEHSFKADFFATFLCKLTDSLRGHRFKVVEVYFVVPIRQLDTFKPKVNALQVQKDVLERVGLTAETTRVDVEAVGLKYKEFRESDDLIRLESKRFKRE
ncbi:hypothetical protein V7S43_002548 [Phytophthora oleae]|uniref:Crinkler effector protein N-terminal domain-containing protein n=1 Tax=Phytophthora oleae TaxID=2107226 RepID=A0ABD3FY83_9STRA